MWCACLGSGLLHLLAGSLQRESCHLPYAQGLLTRQRTGANRIWVCPRQQVQIRGSVGHALVREGVISGSS